MIRKNRISVELHLNLGVTILLNLKSKIRNRKSIYGWL